MLLGEGLGHRLVHEACSRKVGQQVLKRHVLGVVVAAHDQRETAPGRRRGWRSRVVTADPREVADSHGPAADSRKVAKPVSERESLEHEHEIRLPHADRTTSASAGKKGKRCLGAGVKSSESAQSAKARQRPRGGGLHTQWQREN